MLYLETLAERYIEQDALSVEEQAKIVQDAANYVTSDLKNHRRLPQSPATQLAMSIHRWVSSGDDDDGVLTGSRNIEKTARAHKFLSRTLNTLPKSSLQPREVKLFIAFFSSMYQLQDANISAATEALTSLVWMDSFEASSSEDLLSTIGGMNPENYTKQLAKTRSEILELIKILLTGKSGEYLQKRYQGSEHLLRVIGLAGKERDPANLLSWFRDLNTVLAQSTLSQEVADAVFESFSPFFPISIRRSTATGPEVTEQQLKAALNSCFSSNGRLAHRTFPFLLEKLDGGASLTAAAKLDILRTIKACVENYDPIDAYVWPYIPQVWASLKYEVRNGDVPEAIQETLQVFETATSRLARQNPSMHLNEFVDTVWTDSNEDLFENPTFTERLGSILVSVARAHLEPFQQLSPRIIRTISRAISQPKSPAHAKSLLSILNNLLRARRQLLASAPNHTATQEDDLLSVARDIYFAMLKENATQNPTKEQVDLVKGALDGLAQIAQQPSFAEFVGEDTSSHHKDMLQEICSTLTFRYMNDFSIRPATPSDTYTIIEAAAGEALRTTVRAYPEGYGHIVSNLLNEVFKRTWSGTPTEQSFQALQNSCAKIAYIGCTGMPDTSSTAIVNFSIFAGGMLKLLGVLLTTKANFRASAWVAHALHDGILGLIRNVEVQSLLEVIWKQDQQEAAWTLASVEQAVKDIIPTFPNIVSGHFDQFEPSQVPQLLLKGPTSQGVAFVAVLLQLGIYIVAQLYQTATTETKYSTGSVRFELSEFLGSTTDDANDSEGLWRDRYLEVVGDIGRVVCVELGCPAQRALRLDEQIIACFRPLQSSNSGLSWGIHGDGVIAKLSWGVACAIRPRVALSLSTSIYDLLLGDIDSIPELPIKTLLARDQVAYQLANKYDTASTAARSENADHTAWTRVLSEINDTLNDTTKMASMSLNDLSRIVQILTGALRRGDRALTGDMFLAIRTAAVKGGLARGKHMARILNQLFRTPSEQPKAGGAVASGGHHNHTIQKRLYQQRVYYQCIQPVLKESYPLKSQSPDSVINAIYVLHAVRNLTSKQYEEDKPEILRIALAAMQKAENPVDTDAACAIVLHLAITNTSSAMMGAYVSTIIAACKHVYQRGLSIGNGKTDLKTVGVDDASSVWEEQVPEDARPRFVGRVDPIDIRKKSVRLLRLLPEVDEAAVRAYANGVLMHLATVQADKCRDVRQLAQEAKKKWIKVAE
ncbi:Dos2-interacting transcription regulator of RNA-Pol-II-domain-containing protein [Coniella lustricola]|uniref:MMS19 nucleotide excision repair protein n=1 Tax=Coniella lustricola TaxID=2025994 RepID=A0A2T3AAS0_9PEZI|nr:Dos2-interacting transcription regulator of RNA-Pol-II-domain-containing protein [Coniella lustricola]